MPEVTRHIDDGMCVITIDNQPKRNAITHVMARSLLAFLREADADPSVRAVVITGASDKAFSSGHDLSEPPRDAEGDGDLAFGFPREMRKPVIAAIVGHCHAAGLMLAIACDIRVADASSRFGSPGAKLGMLPVGGQIPNLPSIMSPGRAALFMMSAATVDGATAFAWGLADDYAEDGSAFDRAMEIARTIAANSPGVVSSIKVGLLSLKGKSPGDKSAWEQAQSDRLVKLDDAKEGVRAFREKRAPAFADYG